jgi:hypothetical protein
VNSGVSDLFPELRHTLGNSSQAGSLNLRTASTHLSEVEATVTQLTSLLDRTKASLANE